MSDDSRVTTSPWVASARMPLQPRLKESIRTDVCVIGAGIAGMTTAYLLAKEGRSVVVLDDNVIGGGMTGRSTAHLTTAHDDRYSEMQKWHGVEGMRLIAQSYSAAIDTIEEFVNEEQIDCGFERVDGYLFMPPNQPADLLKEELIAAHRAGLMDVEVVERAPIESFDTGPALRFPRQAQFQPLDYLTGLARAFSDYGGRIFSETRAVSIAGGEPARVETEGGPVVTCDEIVVATNAPFSDRAGVETKQTPYVTYVIGMEVPKGSITRALYWDTDEPYHYLRLQSDKFDSSRELLIAGGEDHPAGEEDDSEKRFARLEQWTRERFPQVGEVDFRWFGRVMEPADGIAFIGRSPIDGNNVSIVTGDSGQGMTHGTIAGVLLTDLLQDRSNPWQDLYSPLRLTLRDECVGAGIKPLGDQLRD